MRNINFILNTPILTEYGKYSFEKIGVEDAKALIADGFTSAIGHQGTADVLSAVLGIPVPMNRIAVRMAVGDRALVFRVLQRLEEGKVLSAEELQRVPYELGLLERVA